MAVKRNQSKVAIKDVSMPTVGVRTVTPTGARALLGSKAPLTKKQVGARGLI